MKIQVGKRHIEAAKLAFSTGHKRETHCPIALALAEAGFDTPFVDEHGCIGFLDGTKEKLFLGGDPIKSRVYAFDNEQEYGLKTFTFAIDEERLWTRPVK